jgi:rifamycin polyketide synthase module 1/2/3
MAGYHNQAVATAEVLQHGWYRTGDLGRRDPNGFLTITGRIKELIIRGGENIYPAEVEEALLAAPGVADAAVVAQPHDDLGEVPVAFVVAERPGSLDTEAVLDACREKLSHFKIPAQLIETPEIPRTGSGKIIRYRLREQLEQ